MRSVLAIDRLARVAFARPLALARVTFALVFLLRTTPVLAPFDPVFLRGTNGWLGWPDSGWHVPALGLALPAVVVGALVVIRTLAALALLFGVRWAGAVAGVAGYLVLAQDAFGYMHHLHMLMLGAILFALIDDERIFLMRAFVASIYAWAAIGKLASEWGTGVPLTAFLEHGALDASLVGGVVAGRAAIVEIFVIVTEAALAGCLLWPRTRRYALIAAFALHAMFELVGRVDSIGWQMAALLLVFTGSAPLRSDTRSSIARTSHR